MMQRAHGRRTSRALQYLRVLAYLLCITVLWSVVFLDTRVAVFGMVVSLFAIRLDRLQLRETTLLILLCYFITLLLLQLAGQDRIVLNRVVWLFSGTLILTSWTRDDFRVLTTGLTVWVLLLLVGAMVGEAYSLGGGPGLPVRINPDGSVVALYLSTMATTSYDGLLRVSGVYDEAGAFAFLIWIVVILRSVQQRNEKVSLLLVFLGLMTFSLAHVVLSTVYLVARFRRVVNPKVVVVGAATVLLFGSYIATRDLGGFTDRFTINDGRLSGDNRSGQVGDFFAHVDGKLLLFGDNQNIKSGTVGFDYSSNPFNPIFNNGLPAALPYYVMILYALLAGARSQHKSLWLIFVLLILQRPYLFVFGYSYMILIAFYVLMQEHLWRGDNRASGSVKRSVRDRDAAKFRAIPASG